MKKFKFRLQTVLKEREIREDEKKKEMASALSKLYEQNNFLAFLNNNKSTAIQSSESEKNKKIIDINQVRLYDTYISGLKYRIKNQAVNVKNAELKVSEARQKLTEAMKKRKILSTLKDKDQVDYFMGIYKQEQKDLDEFSVLRERHIKKNK